ncbi:nitronate monooxygenase family protein [Vitiosangium sp. GDMCC 1.1324]|uniref:NAD(P)H-dependent flavin oxidoreductase n=1 Tax=Vitiosangium sp. (strain GDMCC 1.1324) TaxID=2138576 RepID=UPI000D36D75A|nr:nitronate monooxygenase [Vitiosangium sp. GDMCC 1.1324]PTL78437.1 nitronate monooxygenase [Vitiosangium sp. GDMCC 1.1324]
MKTRITQQYGLDVPIISAGMAFVAGPPLAAAVSNAGGMGTLGGAMLPPPALGAMVRATRALTARPFGVDLIGNFVEDAHIEVLAEERVAVVVFFWTLPLRAHVERLRSAGTRVWIQVGSVAEAREAAALGVDAIIAQGEEAGGHNRAEASTFALLPAVRAAVEPVPVIAAGGIVDGRGLVAALALGAEAVWCGTRFLASQEAQAHDEYKRRVLAAGVGDTVRTTLFGPEWPGQSMRVLRNRVVREWAGREAEALALQATEPIGHTEMGGQRVPMPRFSALLPTVQTEGDFEEMSLTVGEACGNVHELRPAATLVTSMVAEAREVLAALVRSAGS